MTRTTDEAPTAEEIDAYQADVERIKDQYESRITEFLNSLVAQLAQRGWEPAGGGLLEADEFSWYRALRRPEPTDDDDFIDVTLEITESLACDGTVAGVTLGLRIVEMGGRILGQFEPYNYTPQVWVDMADADAIAERFELVLRPDLLAQTVDFIDEECRYR